METSRITFVHNCDKDYLTNTILLIKTSGYITQMEELTVKEFIYLWKDLFRTIKIDLEKFMKAQKTAVVHWVSNPTNDRDIWTFINSEGNQLSFNLI